MPRNMPAAHQDASRKCGECQWFTAGFNGTNCQKTRDVSTDTPACIEHVDVLKDPFHEISRDKYVVGIRAELNQPKYLINQNLLDELRTYIIDYHFEKKDLGNASDILKMQEYLTTIVSNRSRVTTIYTYAMDVKSEFDSLMEKLSLWVFSKYEIMRDLKNESLRSAAFNRIVPETIDIRKNLTKCIETAKYIDKKFNEDEMTIRAVSLSCEKLWFSRNPMGQRL